MNKLKAIIYPFDSSSIYFFRYSQMNEHYNIVGAVSPKGWGLCGKDIGQLDGGEALGIKVSASFKEYLDNEYDTVILVGSDKELDFDKFIYSKMEELAKQKKNLVCYRKLKAEQEKALAEIANKYGVSFESRLQKKQITCPFTTQIYDINVPIIVVAGISERTKKFEIQLSLREELLKKGYNMSQVGSVNHCEAFGFHSFPQFMFDSTLSEIQKVVMFNKTIKALELNEKPDGIIIGIPGGMLPVNNKFTNGFGILHYLVSQAVRPDASVISVQFKDYTPEFYKELGELIKYRFGFNVDCFNLSNSNLNILQSVQNDKEYYITVDSSYINKEINGYGELCKPVYNIINREDRKVMAEYINGLLVGEESIQNIV